jgi:hypothetical protein
MDYRIERRYVYSLTEKEYNLLKVLTADVSNCLAYLKENTTAPLTSTVEEAYYLLEEMVK